LHDVALQELDVRILVDRAGLASADGATHHGIFDTAFISEIPNVTLYSPNSFDSLEKCFADAIDASGPIVIRYPKSGDIDCTGFYSVSGVSFKDFGVHPENAVITYGRLQENACLAAESLQSNGKPTRVISLTRLSPLPTEDISKLLNGIGNIVFAEEGIKNGGVSQRLCAELTEMNLLDGKRVRIKAVDGIFPDHGSNKDLLDLLSLSHEAIISAFEEE
jgi:1-deoxy-D-xylulose-5-phosphate synthase